MKIAICDDDSQEFARISSFIDTYRRESKAPLTYKTFQSATELISISETELCALLSNGLENAIEAAEQAADEQFRKVRISCQTHKGNLLIFIENSFTGKVSIEGGLPQSLREGHGFGVKSMAMIAEKYNGYCSFEAKDEILP